jgi:hypothetical protein
MPSMHLHASEHSLAEVCPGGVELEHVQAHLEQEQRVPAAAV